MKLLRHMLDKLWTSCTSGTRRAVMTDRVETENLLRQMYAARLRGDLDGVCDGFQPGATFQISGASFGTPMVMSANGIDQFRPLLAIMVKISHTAIRRSCRCLSTGRMQRSIGGSRS